MCTILIFLGVHNELRLPVVLYIVALMRYYIFPLLSGWSPSPNVCIMGPPDVFAVDDGRLYGHEVCYDQPITHPSSHMFPLLIAGMVSQMTATWSLANRRKTESLAHRMEPQWLYFF
jgi:hypothetical protein